MRNTADVVVVGAGWAGLSAAQALSQRGRDVVVVEKSRGPGGRSATRREAGWAFDHGAQYMTADSAPFQEQLSHWRELGLVATWTPRIAVIGPRPDTLGTPRQPNDRTRWVGVPGNNAVLKHLASSQRVLYRHRVDQINRLGDRWQIDVSIDQQTQRWEAKHLILTAPPQQAAALLGHNHEFYAMLTDHPMRPCWTLMLGFRSVQALDWDAAFVNEGPLSWICRQSSKPGRDGEAWVVHASADWSEAHLEDEPTAVAEAMWKAFQQAGRLGGSLPDAHFLHRWRYAQSAQALDVGHLSDPANGLWIAGDWCHGNRVEGAWLSGLEAALSLAD